jgi:hypothetical protein
MKLKIKPKPFGILKIGMLVGFVGAFLRILKYDFAEYILMSSLIINALGVYVFYKWYKKVREREKYK